MYQQPGLALELHKMLSKGPSSVRRRIMWHGAGTGGEQKAEAHSQPDASVPPLSYRRMRHNRSGDHGQGTSH